MLGLTPDERKVVIFFLAANALGLAVLAYKRTHPSALPELSATAAGLPEPADGDSAAAAAMPEGQHGQPSVRPTKQLLSGKVDINRADIGSLQRLPGIGPAMARRIIDHRGREGRFTAPEQLAQVKGIGPKKLKLLLEHVSVGP